LVCGDEGGEDVDIITDSLDDDEVDPVDGDETEDMVEQIIFAFIFELVVDDDVDDDENFFSTSF